MARGGARGLSEGRGLASFWARFGEREEREEVLGRGVLSTGR